MMHSTILVSERCPIADQLCAVLVADGMAVRQMRPAEVLAGWDRSVGGPDFLLVNADLGAAAAQLLTRLVTRLTKRAPALMVFVNEDYAALEPHVLAGVDYMVPPYAPGHARDRLLACQLRHAMSQTAEANRTTTDLLRYEQEMAIGREIQAGFLPEWLPCPAGWEFTARFLPAREVAGDFYDAFEMLDGRRIAMVVADVCDKGVGAALFMALIRSLLRHTAVYLDKTAQGRPVPDADDGSARGAERLRDEAMLMRAVVATNDYLIENHLKQAYFATLFFAILDPGTGSLVYVNCGHNPPVIRRRDGTVVLLPPTGPALGLLPDAEFFPARTSLDPGDLLFAYTDGVTEARNPAGEQFGEEQMTALVCTDCPTAHELLDCVEKHVVEHAGSAEQSDDITMIAMHRQSPGARRRPRHRPSATSSESSNEKM